MWNTWDVYRPRWFITLLWKGSPDFIQAQENTRHFRNVFFRKAYHLSSPRKIKKFPYRMGTTSFQERKDILYSRGSIKEVFHTHIHLYGADVGAFWDRDEWWKLDWFIRSKVAPECDLLLKTTTKHNEGVVVRKWVRQDHSHYNFKDYRQHLHHQDGDLVLDYKNSDLLSIERNKCYR